jgi:hypothetical protein
MTSGYHVGRVIGFTHENISIALLGSAIALVGQGVTIHNVLHHGIKETSKRHCRTFHESNFAGRGCLNQPSDSIVHMRQFARDHFGRGIATHSTFQFQVLRDSVQRGFGTGRCSGMIEMNDAVFSARVSSIPHWCVHSLSRASRTLRLVLWATVRESNRTSQLPSFLVTQELHRTFQIDPIDALALQSSFAVIERWSL